MYVHDMIVYMETPKGYTKKLQKLITGFNKVSGYAIYTEKSIIFLYLKMNMQKPKLKTQTLDSCYKENEILRYLLNKTYMGSVC